MLLWLTIQLVALAIGAAGLQLSNRRQTPPEFLAIDVLLVTQIATAALLWPMLMADWRSAVAVILSSLPFMQAAGFVSATPTSDFWPAATLTILWLTTLAVLPKPKSSPTFMSALRMAVALWSIGGALATYLHAEFSADDSTNLIGPISQVLGRLHGQTNSMHWIAVAIVLFVAIIIRVINRSVASKNKVK